MNGDKISYKKLLSMLHELDNELVKSGQTTDMRIYGGMVMCMVYNARSMTEDVDAVFSNSKIVYELARKVAANNKLADPDWLNDSVRIVSNEIKRQKLKKIHMFKNITLWLPSAEQMFAMKAIAARQEPKSDINDMIALAKSLGIKSTLKANMIIDGFYGIGAHNRQKTKLAVLIVARELGWK